MKITPIILCGGSGTRLWPVSRKNLPKQFSDFFGEETLFQKTILRFEDKEIFSEPVIICNEEHRFVVASQLQDIKVNPLSIILEPESKNTASAIALGSFFVKKNYPENIIIAIPSDHLIKNSQEFSKKIFSAIDIAKKGKIVTFGIAPHYPETGYGYIERAHLIDEKHQIFEISKFIEKPSFEKAQQFFENENYFWNAGIFMCQSQFFLESLKKFENEIFINCQNAFEKAQKDLDFIRIDKNEFAKCKNISVDYAIIEKEKNLALVSLDIDWSDVGSWHAIADNAVSDNEGNAKIGNVISSNTKNCYINSLSNQLIATVGIKDLIITTTPDAVLIANKNQTQDVKILYEEAQKLNPKYCENNFKTLRPWGSFEVLNSGSQYKVKKISVNAHSSLSLQLHNHRAEHWIVIKGTAHIENDGKEFVLKENESTFISLGKKHRLHNKTNNQLEIIEIQTGKYLEEDDILRFNDKYGR